MSKPRRGEVWYVDLEPTRGHEQGGRRPALVISVDALNLGPADLLIVVPITSRAKGVRSHVEIAAGEAGLTKKSFAKCEDIRSISTDRLGRRLGTVAEATLRRVEVVTRYLLGL
ncbi:MAG: growth inhibitor PemK [Planctomycetota bacterium]|nr:MAG: growth inhibitor PemK [Planctomycetota bacterium]